MFSSLGATFQERKRGTVGKTNDALQNFQNCLPYDTEYQFKKIPYFVTI
jgi:hypothetical protein